MFFSGVVGRALGTLLTWIRGRGGSAGTDADAQEYNAGMVFLWDFFVNHQFDEWMVSYQLHSE